MTGRDASPSLPPSGGWSGYYRYSLGGGKHRMKMSLAFSLDGRISGDGMDDIAPFTINGVFDMVANAASWTKVYAGMHTLEYRGLYNQRSICGNWSFFGTAGEFWIWPDGMGREEESESELEHPVDLFVR